MRIWHLLPILLPTGWLAGTLLDLWPEPQREMLSNPMFALAGLGIGLAVAIVIDLVLKRARPTRLPTEREIAKMPDPTKKPLIEGITPAPVRPAPTTARRSPNADAPATSSAAPGPDAPPPNFAGLKVPMPDDPTEEPTRRRR